jgi:hypothetical protein
MVTEAVAIEVAGRLSERLGELSAQPLADRLLLVRQVTEQVRALHNEGRSHRRISLNTVLLDADMRPRVGGRAARQRFGGENYDPDVCPPEFAGREAIEIPDDAAVAAS